MLSQSREIASFLFPSRCLACDRNPVTQFFRGGVCGSCWRALPPPDPWRCERCDESLPGVEPSLCGRCLIDPPAFESLRAAAPYRGSAREILRGFKFRSADYLGARMASAMEKRLSPPPSFEEVVAIPATARGRRRRGYHPAEVLAVALCHRLGHDLSRERLEKTRETEIQSRLPASRRAANVRGAFRVRGRPARSLLLVDDIATSGATARECTRLLRAAGAEHIFVWCFARASRNDIEPETS